MSCLAIQIVKAYSVVTSIFSMQQLFYKMSDQIIGTSIEYQTQFNDHRITFYNDPVYQTCFESSKDKYQHLTISKNIVTNSYLINDPSLRFVNPYVNVTSSPSVNVVNKPSTLSSSSTSSSTSSTTSSTSPASITSTSPSQRPSIGGTPRRRATSSGSSTLTQSFSPLVVTTDVLQIQLDKLVPNSKFIISEMDPNKHNLILQPVTTPTPITLTRPITSPTPIIRTSPVTRAPITVKLIPITTTTVKNIKPVIKSRPITTSIPIPLPTKKISSKSRKMSSKSRKMPSKSRKMSSKSRKMSSKSRKMSSKSRKISSKSKKKHVPSTKIFSFKPKVKKNTPVTMKPTIAPFHLSSLEKCKKDHGSYYNKNWFSRIFYANPCVQQQYEIVKVNLTNTYEKCIIGKQLWPSSKAFKMSDQVKAKVNGHPFIRQCSHTCYTNRYRYVGIGDEDTCLCSQQPPSPKVSIYHNLCKKCSDDSSKKCGNKKYGFVSVYQIL